ncbi:MAG: AAA family ATPase [Oscillospiraceae bacterium]|nr:AAA family ATPase [Oscillospiraceae bacterium]
MAEQKEFPIGIEDFKTLIDNNYYFVDKTLFLKELIHNIGKVNLFTRPRRFGKSLNLSMIQYYFEKQKTDNAYLFEGLKISQTGEEYQKYMGQYPVITLSFKGMKKKNYHKSIHQFKWMIARECKRHPEILNSDAVTEDEKVLYQQFASRTAEEEEYTFSIQFLADCLMKIYDKKVIILIDEYDVPLENAHFMGFYDEMIDFIRTLFENALKTNNSLEMAVLTGCLRVSKESLFTGLNNPQINSIQSGKFSEYFGFTEQEVRDLTEYFELSDKFSVIKEWYDGYCFGETEIYNPWSVLNYLQDAQNLTQAVPKPYWSNTSSNSIIHQLIAEADEDTRDTIEELVNGGSVTAPVHEDMVYADIKINRDDIWSFLLFTGYLKQIEMQYQDGENYLKMVIPNQEVKMIYRRTIRQWFNENIKRTSRENLLTALLTEDVETLNQIVGTWLDETISFYDEKEIYYHGFMAGLLSGFKGYKLKSNRESGDGRLDLVMLERNGRRAIILELKIAKKGRTLDSMADEAVKQIEEMQYEKELLQDGYQKIIKYGIAFQKKKCLIKQG